MNFNGDITRALDLDTLEIQGAEGRTLVARLLRWDVENEVSDDGRLFYTEVWDRGSFAQTIKRAEVTGKKWPMFLNHRRSDAPIGAVVAIHEQDDGPWMTATADPATTAKYGWKLYHYTWKGAPAGEHTLVSRVTDANGKVQPTSEEIESKKTFLEDNSQHPRKVMIA